MTSFLKFVRPSSGSAISMKRSMEIISVRRVVSTTLDGRKISLVADYNAVACGLHIHAHTAPGLAL